MKIFTYTFVLISIALTPAITHASGLEIRLVVPSDSKDSEMLTLERSEFKETLHVSKESLVTNEHLKDVIVEEGSSDCYQVRVYLTAEGEEAFTNATRAAKGGRLAILIDGEVYSSPRVLKEITGDSFSISGRYDLEEARRIAAALESPHSTDDGRKDRESNEGMSHTMLKLRDDFR